MQDITVSNSTSFELDDILGPDEQVLWSGTPSYGRRFWQTVGDERVFHIAVLIGVLILWSTLFWIGAKTDFDRIDVIAIYSAATLLLFGWAAYLASERQYVLNTLLYFVTNKRAIICRRGRNWRLGVRLYVVSVPHSKTYPYAVIDTRPYPSVEIGTLLSVDQVQPFGMGLAHPGHSVLRHRITSVVSFDYISNAQAVLETIQSLAAES